MSYEHFKACFEVVLWVSMSVVLIGILCYYAVKFFEESGKYMTECERRMDLDDELGKNKLETTKYKVK